MEDQEAVTTPVPSADGSKNAEACAVSTNQPILKVENLKKYFPIKTNFFGKPTRFLKAVDDISFELEKGKTIGVVGESGCGKTTLGRTILKLYESDGGKIFFMGNDITDLKKRQMMKYRTDIQLIFQDPYSSLPPRMTVGSIIAEPVRVHKIVPKNEVYGYVIDIMKKCGLKPTYYDRYPHEFSGGQRQRICIARALAVKPKLVICDEPVSALDVSIQAQIINLLKDLQKSIGLTYVFISHDLSVVKYITDNILVMYLGNAMEMSETEELFDNPLHPYTQALFSAVPAPNPSVKMNRIMLEGDIPSPANPPSGCKFHTRCSKCMKVCKFKLPEYTEVKPGHYVACHLYNEDVMSRLDEYDAEYDRLEEERRLAIELVAQKKRGGKAQNVAPTESTESTEPIAEENAVKPEPMTEAPNSTETTDTPESDISKEYETADVETTAVVNESDEISEDKEEKKTEAQASVNPVETTDAKNEQSASAVEKAPEPKKKTAEKTAAKKSTAKSTAAKKTTADKKPSEETAASDKPTAKKTQAPKQSTAKNTAVKAEETKADKPTTAGKKPTAGKTGTATRSAASRKSSGAAKKPSDGASDGDKS